MGVVSRVMEENIELTTLIHYILQKSYGDLTQLTELLPRKTDIDRKLDIVQYARQTRQLLIRLLSLVKWAKTAGPVRQCSDVSRQINHQSWVFIDTADQLANLARNTLHQAAMPNLSLAPAVDVVTTGSYPRLPTCIQDKIIPPPPLTPNETSKAFVLLESVIRYTLIKEHLPEAVIVKSIDNGRVKLVVPYEFEIVLTVVSDDPHLPWRVLDLKILVEDALPGSPVLITYQQHFYLHQLIQSRLCSEDGSLSDMFNVLHYFCLSLQLDCLQVQIERLNVAVCGIYMKVEEYIPGDHVRLAYWCSSTFPQSDISMCPKITFSIQPSSYDKSLLTIHSPPLDCDVSLQTSKLSVQDLLVECIRIRSISILKNLKKSLIGSAWENEMSLDADPPCLSINLSLSFATYKLLLSIDIRMGQVIASLEGFAKAPNNNITKLLQTIEKNAIANSLQLSTHLSQLVCELYLMGVASLSNNFGITYTYSLPLLCRLPHSSRHIMLKLNNFTYLVVSADMLNGQIIDKYHLLRVTPTTHGSNPTHDNVPKAFLQAESLIEIDVAQAYHQLTGSITVKQVNSKLKRKVFYTCHMHWDFSNVDGHLWDYSSVLISELQDRSLCLPSAKRLCIYPSIPFPSLAGVLSIQDTLSLLQSSLLSVDVFSASKATDTLGTPCVEVFAIQTKDHDSSLLSSLLVSYVLWPQGQFVRSKIIFNNIINPDGPAVVIKRDLPFNVIGQLIKQDWIDKSTLLHHALELKCFIDKNTPPFNQCSVKSFNYETLVIQYGEHTLSVIAKGDGMIIECPTSSPHYHLTSTLQSFLSTSLSLPLLVQGLCLTKVAMSKLAIGFKSPHSYQISGVTPSHLKLSRGYLSLNLQLLSEGGVSFCGVSCVKDSVPPIVNQLTLIGLLQSFIDLQLTGQLPNESVMDEGQPGQGFGGLKLHPAGHGVVSSRLSSPIPSIPSLPPPLSEPPDIVSSMQNPSWERHVSSSQLNTLLKPNSEGLNPLEQFIGSLALLIHWVKEASMDRYLLQQMVFISVDRGMFSYKTESLGLEISLNQTTMTSVHLNLKPISENTWSPAELQILTDFFHSHVVKPPYQFNAVSAFMQLFWIPLKTLKACINIMKLQMNPSPDHVWRVEICLLVPKSLDLGDFARIGSPGIIFRGKVLIFLNFIRQSNQMQFTVPFLHDPKTNQNFVARRSSPPRQRNELSPLLQSIDQMLRKPQMAELTPPNESSLIYCVKYMLTLNLPI